MSAIDLRVLGPVEVWHAGRQLVLRRRQQRQLLGILILEAGTPVPVDRLVHLLWGESPPAQARPVLQTRISELRAAIGVLAADPQLLRLESSGTSYLLHAQPDTIDSARFTTLAGQARSASNLTDSAQALRAALALWRGPVLDTEPSGPIWSSYGLALQSARLTAVEDLLAVELHLGDAGRIADRAVTESLAHPDRERLAGLALRALHAAGRSTHALAHYDQWRRWLREEYGVDPSGELQALHLALLRGAARLPADAADPFAGRAGGAQAPPAADLPTAPAVVNTLPPDIADFTGRTAEVDLARGLLIDPAPARMRVVAVSGPGGVGKTALALHVAHGLADIYPDGRLYANLRGIEEDRPASPAEILVRFLRALGVDSAGLPASFEERVDLYRNLLAGRRVLLVLDNVADEDQVVPLIPGDAGCGVILTSRRRLGATLGAVGLPLDVLAPDQAADLLAVLAGQQRVSAEPQAAAELCTRCGLLPLAIRVAGAKLATKPHWGIAKLAGLLADEHGRLDQFSYGHLDVRASVGLSYRELSAQARTLLGRLAELDAPEYPVWLAAALLDTTVPAAEALCEELFDAQLLDIVGSEQNGQPRFRMHDLVRLYAREQAHRQQSPQELAAAGQRAAGALLHLAVAAARRVDPGLWIPVAETDACWPLPDSTAEGLIVHSSTWLDQELQLIEALVRRSAATPTTGVCWQLVLTLSPGFQMRRENEIWQDMLQLALDAADATGDGRAEALVRYAQGIADLDRGRYDDGLRTLLTVHRDFAHRNEPVITGRVRLALGVGERAKARNGPAREWFESALPLLREASPPTPLAFVMRSLGQLAMEDGDLEAADEYLTQASAIFRGSGSIQGGASTLFWHGQLRLRQGRLAEAEEQCRAALAVARSIGDKPGIVMTLYGLGLCLIKSGDREGGRARLEEALRLRTHPTPGPLDALIHQALAEA
jgi:DNA-binding SARP family transcriptional activator